MLTNRYSITLPLLGAFLFGGCAEPPSNPYNVPRLLGANRQQAETILGKPDSTSTLLGLNTVEWSAPQREYFVSIDYNATTKLPDAVTFRPNPIKKWLDLESVLRLTQLSMDNPNYEVSPMSRTRTVTVCYGVIVTPK